jgi:hypothetical protein
VVSVARVAAQTGQWSAPIAWPLVANHAALLTDGKVLVWSDQLNVTPRVWDPANGALTTASQISTNIVGSAQALLADGDVAIIGGRLTNGTGIQDAHNYDRGVTSWFPLQYMTQPRDEASAVLLGDGRLLAISGERIPGQATDEPEIITPGSAWSVLEFAVLALPRTPWVFQLSTGKVLVAGPDHATRRLDVSGDGSWSAVDNMLAGSRDAGTAVLVPGATDRVLAIGGRDPAVTSCELLDLPTTNSWSAAASMARARRHHNATLLADGSVLVTGGTLTGDNAAYSVLAAERYLPASDTWTTLASMSMSRRRGSVALLLPDARVLCAGGGTGAAGSELHADAEVFSPPYLFLGPRPTVTLAPANVSYGGGFTIDTPQAQDIADVWLVRSGSAARGFNSDQRAVSLSFTAAPGRLTVTAPGNGNAAPPGMYLLFLVNDAGAPSLGQIVRLAVGNPTPIAPDITSAAPTETRVSAPFTYLPAASGTQPMTWSLTTAPAWLAVSPSTGAVSGVPTTTGQFNVTLRAQNSGGFDTQSWVLTVTSGSGVRSVIPLGATWRYFKGTANPPSNWATIAFNDATWLTGPSGFGFGDNDDATVLSDMINVYSTVFTRKTFTCYNVNTVSKVSILYEFDDGFAVYLNGTRIFAQNAPATIVNTSLATSSHEAGPTLFRQDLTDPATRALLVNGTNVLAAVGLNQTLSSSDVTLKITLELTGGTDTPIDAGPETAASFAGAGPNPFASETVVRFAVARAGDARLDVWDAAGRWVRRVDATRLAAGPHALAWDGRDARGVRVAPGVYFYRLQAPDLDRHGKLTVAR